MARPLRRAEAEATLRGERAMGNRLDVLRALPDDVDPELAANVAFELAERPGSFGRSCRNLPLPVIEALLPKLECSSTEASLFVREYLRLSANRPLRELWSEALSTLLDFDTSYGWGSKQRKAKFARIAADPRLLAATRAVAVGCEDASLSVLAVLTIDGSDESVDALMPHFVRAAEKRDRALDMLQNLRVHATPTPAIVSMLADVERLLGVRNAESPALELGRAIVGPVDEFWFHAFLMSAETRDRVPIVQANITVNSRSAEWFSVSVSRQPDWVSFNESEVHRDTFGVGRCTAAELPKWLGAVAARLECTWNFETSWLRTGLRGKRRDQLFDWLASGVSGGTRDVGEDSS